MPAAALARLARGVPVRHRRRLAGASGRALRRVDHRHRGRHPDRRGVLRSHPRGRRLPRLAPDARCSGRPSASWRSTSSTSSPRCTSDTRRPASSTMTTPATSTWASRAPSGMGIHSFLDGVALAAGLAVGGGTAHRHRGRRDHPPLQRRDRRGQLPARQPRAIAGRVPLADPRRGRADRRRAARARHPGAGRSARAPCSRFFAGFFLYVGAAELLPEAHRRDRSRWIVMATVGGAIAIYVFSVAVGAIGIEHPSASAPQRSPARAGRLKPFRAPCLDGVEPACPERSDVPPNPQHRPGRPAAMVRFG